MYEEIHWVLEHWQRLADSLAAKSSISNIIQQHIPDVMDAYLQVVGHDRDEQVEDIVGILDIFQQEAAGIRQAAEANSVSMLRERTLAVELQYGVMPVLKDTDG